MVQDKPICVFFYVSAKGKNKYGQLLFQRLKLVFNGQVKNQHAAVA